MTDHAPLTEEELKRRDRLLQFAKDNPLPLTDEELADCPAIEDGVQCDQSAGHPGLHSADGWMIWDDLEVPSGGSSMTPLTDEELAYNRWASEGQPEAKAMTDLTPLTDEELAQIKVRVSVPSHDRAARAALKYVPRLIAEVERLRASIADCSGSCGVVSSDG